MYLPIFGSADIIKATINLSAPAYDNFWISSLRQWHRPGDFHFATPIGFAADIRGVLPVEALDTLHALVELDGTMDHMRSHSTKFQDMQSITGLRNAVQHRLLSLPFWVDLQQSERVLCSESSYDCCRITARVYASAVTFPLPTNTGWQKTAIVALQRAVQIWIATQWENDVDYLLIWMLFVGGMVAVSSRYSLDFRILLAQALRKANIKTWDAAEAVLRRFLWTDAACETGGLEVWESVQLLCETSDAMAMS
jgi:nuclear transport factor 2 (NTF2) superfamily protein